MAQVIQHPAIAAQNGNQKPQEMPEAKSSFLMNASYDSKSLQLTVTMKNGAQYIYFYVYPNVWEDFQKAPSKGEFYAKLVRGKHASTRIIDKNVGKKVSTQTKKKGRNHG